MTHAQPPRRHAGVVLRRERDCDQEQRNDDDKRDDLDARVSVLRSSCARPLVEPVSRRAWRLSRRIAASARSLDDDSVAERVHRVRIDAKKLRYLVDVMPAFFDAGDLGCILGALKKLQRVLGDFNDAHVHETRLLECGRALCAAGRPAGVLLTLGRLAEQNRQRRDRLRESVAEKLARFRAHETWSACRRAFKRA